MTPKVIDVYHGNVVHDFAALKNSGIVGVIHKCTQGIGIADPLYAARRKQIVDAGLLFGAYSFNTGEDVATQVSSFISHAEPDGNTLMALDFEDNPHSQMSILQARQFLELGAERLGRKLVLYSGNRVKDLLGNFSNPFFGSHRLWLAQYGPVARVQASWSKPWLWQFSENGKLPGTDGLIDLNAFDGGNDELAQSWAS